MTEALSIELAGGALHVSPEDPTALAGLCDYASRLNPKRGFLFVSKVLGKHIPVRPSQVLKSHEQLADALTPFLEKAESAFFLGFAETATGLGAGVFEAALRRFPSTPFLFSQTTRYRMGVPLALHFQEEHSHSTGHLLHSPLSVHPAQQLLMRKAKTLVMVDDEMSTGRTSANFLRAFLAVNPGVARVAMVSLVNWMSPARRVELKAEFPSVEIEFVSLLNGEFSFQPKEGYVCPVPPCVDGRAEPAADVIPVCYGRLGETKAHPTTFPGTLAMLKLDPKRPVHVLGDGEFMHPPLLLAAYLEKQGFDVWFQSTTRSPILVGGAVQDTTTFEDHYGDGIPNFAHNLPALDSAAQLVLCHEAHGPLHLTRKRPLKTISYGALICN